MNTHTHGRSEGTLSLPRVLRMAPAWVCAALVPAYAWGTPAPVLESEPTVFLTEHSVLELETVSAGAEGRGRLVAAVHGPPHKLWVFKQSADGFAWPPEHTVELDEMPRGLAMGDFFGDGLVDIGVTTSRSLWLFSEADAYANAGTDVSAFHNMNQGGHRGLSAHRLRPDAAGLDFVVGPVLRHWRGGRDMRNAYFYGPESNNNRGAAVADLDGDGYPDLVFGARGEDLLRLYYGPFPAREIHPHLLSRFVELKAPRDASPPAVGDMNDDRRLDIVVAGRDAEDGTAAVYFYYQNSPLDFTAGAGPSWAIRGGEPRLTFRLADMNGNGLTDLVVLERGRRASRLLVFLQKPDRPWPNAIEDADQIIALDFPAAHIWLLDFHGSGLPDLVVSRQYPRPRQVLVYRNTGL